MLKETISVLLIKFENHSKSANYTVTVDGESLVINYSWDALFNFNALPSLKSMLGSALNLKPIIEKYYVELTAGTISSLKDELKFIFDKDIEITMDWQCVFSSATYNNDAKLDFLVILRDKIARMPAALINW